MNDDPDLAGRVAELETRQLEVDVCVTWLLAVFACASFHVLI
jgi:hypothetical protein